MSGLTWGRARGQRGGVAAEEGGVTVPSWSSLARGAGCMLPAVQDYWGKCNGLSGTCRVWGRGLCGHRDAGQSWGASLGRQSRPNWARRWLSRSDGQQLGGHARPRAEYACTFGVRVSSSVWGRPALPALTAAVPRQVFLPPRSSLPRFTLVGGSLGKLLEGVCFLTN